MTDAGEPECYDEPSQTEDASKWELAMKDEMKSLISKQTWELAELPIGKKTLGNKWVYRVKEKHDGSNRYKDRLVVKRFQQKIEASKNPTDMLIKTVAIDKLKLCSTSVGLLE